MQLNRCYECGGLKGRTQGHGGLQDMDLAPCTCEGPKPGPVKVEPKEGELED